MAVDVKWMCLLLTALAGSLPRTIVSSPFSHLIVTLRKVRVRVRVGLELRLGLGRVRIRVRVRFGLDLGLGVMLG